MTNKLILNSRGLLNRIQSEWLHEYSGKKVYGVRRGGWLIAQMLVFLGLAEATDSTEEADIIVDDIIDSGSTRDRWQKHTAPGKPFWAPYDKTIDPGIPWIVFPWEKSGEDDAEELVTRMIQFIGDKPEREGLKDTPARVVRSWKELYSGYSQDPAKVLEKVFKSDNDAMVICKDIEFYSTCEHHMIPFFGTVSIGYLPNGSVVGLSKLARLVEIFARRLQIQEQMTFQIAKALQTGIEAPDREIRIEKVREDNEKGKYDRAFLPSFEEIAGYPLGVGVVINAKHLCMCGRGVSKQGSSMTTSAMLGKFRTDPSVRAEFLQLIQ